MFKWFVYYVRSYSDCMVDANKACALFKHTVALVVDYKDGKYLSPKGLTPSHAVSTVSSVWTTETYLHSLS